VPTPRRQDVLHLATRRFVHPAPTQHALSTLEWIGRGKNLAVAGPSGTGKSHFVEAIAKTAIDNNLRVVWFTLETQATTIGRPKPRPRSPAPWPGVAAATSSSSYAHTATMPRACSWPLVGKEFSASTLGIVTR
jgi:ABC-type dipeptide/oligopeptide/nickel transport system ATPase component